MSVTRTDPAMVNAIVTDLHPPRADTASGYGRKLPTRWRVRYGARWHRVYMMCYGNAASAYIRNGDTELFLDIATEYALSDGLTSTELGI